MSNPIGLYDIHSLMPQRVKALYFDGSRYLRIPNFAPLGEKGFTYVFGIKYDSSAGGTILVSHRRTSPAVDQYEIQKYTNNTIRFLWNNNNSSQNKIEQPLTSGLNLSNGVPLESWTFPRKLNDGNPDIGFNNYHDGHLNNGIVDVNSVLPDLSTIDDELYIGGRGGAQTSFYAYYFAIFKGVLSQKDILSLCNNTLLKNPSIQQQNNNDSSLELFIDFNNPFQVDSSLYLPDLSKNEYTVEALGYADISTMINNQADIDSLRS